MRMYFTRIAITACYATVQRQQAHPGMTSASYALASTESKVWFSANLCPGFSEYVCAPCRSPARRHSEVAVLNCI